MEHDENLVIKAIEQSKKRFNDEISLTDIYVEKKIKQLQKVENMLYLNIH